MENKEQCDDIKKIKVVVEQHKEEFNKLEKRVSEHDKILSDIVEYKAESKVYVEQVKQQIDRLENRLFSFMNDLVKNLTAKETKEIEVNSKERTQTTSKWMGLLETVIKLTVAALIGYMFAGGFKG